MAGEQNTSGQARVLGGKGAWGLKSATQGNEKAGRQLAFLSEPRAPVCVQNVASGERATCSSPYGSTIKERIGCLNRDICERVGIRSSAALPHRLLELGEGGREPFEPARRGAYEPRRQPHGDDGVRRLLSFLLVCVRTVVYIYY